MNGEKILALDIGGSKIMAARTMISESDGKKRCEILEIVNRRVESGCTREQLLEILFEQIEMLQGARECSAIGANIPGLADPERGMWIYAPFSGIENIPISDLLSEKLGGKPVAIENDVNACAHAERIFGACTEVEDFLWITVSNGIGGALVLGGEVYRGHFGNAGEIGHFNIVENGAKCGCGNSGCLEAEAAGPAIARKYRNAKNSPRNESNLEEGGLEKILDAKHIAERARNSDPLAQQVYWETGTLIGKAVAYAVNLINPAKIIFGGGVSGAFDLLEPGLRDSLRRYVFHPAYKGLTLEKTALGYEAALVGAAAIAYRAMQRKVRE